MKKMVLIAGSVVVMGALMFAGITYAQTATPPPGDGQGVERGGHGLFGPGDADSPIHDLKLDALADGLGLTREELDTRLAAGERLDEIAEAEGLSQEEFAQIRTEARQTALDEAVAQGLLTQEEADQMLTHEGRHGFGPGLGGPKGGPEGQWFGPDGALRDTLLNSVADGLGLSRADLDTRLEAGERLNEIAEAEGLSQEEMVQVMTDAHAAALAEGVAQGLLTQDEADALLSRPFGPGFMPGRGHRFGPGFGPGGEPGTAPTPAPDTNTGFDA